MGTAFEVFPEALFRPERWVDWVLMIKPLPISPRRKKELICEWCNITGVALTREMVEEVLGLEAERGRG